MLILFHPRATVLLLLMAVMTLPPRGLSAGSASTGQLSSVAVGQRFPLCFACGKLISRI